MANEGYLEASLQNDVEKCLFIAEIDDKTTKMCSSLDGQTFYLNVMNTYQRYSDMDKRIVTYHTKGLVIGENLPPIDNHFHWCRSVITYLIDQPTNELRKQIKPIKMYEDVTNKWLKNAKPNSHKVLEAKEYVYNGTKYKVDGHNVVLDYSNKEKEVAEWLENTFGGELYLLPRINNPKGMQTADYFFKNECWDLKEIVGNGKHTLDTAIKKKKSQTSNFLFDVSNSELSNKEIKRQLDLMFKSRDRQWVDKIMIKRNNYVIAIYKRKKRD